MNTKVLYRKLPSLIKSTLIISDGWLVGSSIGAHLEDRPVNDYDIIVPIQNWERTIVSLREFEYRINTFGGLKFQLEEGTGRRYELDIWPQDLHNFLARADHQFQYAYNITYQRLLEKK